MTFMCVQPCIQYYAWQVEVMLDNFIEIGMHYENDIHCIFAYNKRENNYQDNIELIKKLESKYKGVANFFYYQDTREYPIKYISGIRPNCLKQHFFVNDYLENEQVFYHDCDIVFTKYPYFIHGLRDDCWYLSDTISYIGHDYIISKGEQVLDKMCDIVGIDKEKVKENQLNSGGAQYIMHGLDWKFFEKMEKDCERLFNEINELNNSIKKENPTYHELQIWCADMWALLWGAWIRNYNTKVIKEMEFCWATDRIERFDECYIFHNAGVVSSADGMFYKYDFRNKYPYNEDFSNIDKTKATYKYVEMIQKTAKNSVLI